MTDRREWIITTVLLPSAKSSAIPVVDCWKDSSDSSDKVKQRSLMLSIIFLLIGSCDNDHDKSTWPWMECAVHDEGHMPHCYVWVLCKVYIIISVAPLMCSIAALVDGMLWWHDEYWHFWRSWVLWFSSARLSVAKLSALMTHAISTLTINWKLNLLKIRFPNLGPQGTISSCTRYPDPESSWLINTSIICRCTASRTRLSSKHRQPCIYQSR